MSKNKLLITGGSGLVGYGIKEIMKENNKYKIIYLSSKDCNLEKFDETLTFFKKVKPKYVIHLAACVGGLFKNMNCKVEMLEKNININSNVLKACHETDVKKVISCLSTCIFPDKTSYPIDESMLHNGPPHNSNYAYAYAKRLLEIHAKVYQEQFNKDFICVIPTNIYGPNDNYSLTDGHVIPALIHRCYLAKKQGIDFVVKGSGKPLRQFIYSLDLARLMIWVLEEYKKRETIILSVGEKDEVSIKKVAEEISINFDYKHRISFDTTAADGQYKKTANNKKLVSLHPELKFISIQEGIKETVDWFIKNIDICRK